MRQAMRPTPLTRTCGARRVRAANPTNATTQWMRNIGLARRSVTMMRIGSASRRRTACGRTVISCPRSATSVITRRSRRCGLRMTRAMRIAARATPVWSRYGSAMRWLGRATPAARRIRATRGCGRRSAPMHKQRRTGRRATRATSSARNSVGSATRDICSVTWMASTVRSSATRAISATQVTGAGAARHVWTLIRATCRRGCHRPSVSCTRAAGMTLCIAGSRTAHVTVWGASAATATGLSTGGSRCPAMGRRIIAERS
mmetsp:Transcript_38140/g.93336  ORF Transcript_38140/g.93336 Transcript_38140/m.93336 type:complete len:260 (+) Transcript_38140:263-1042(+)